jgi:adenylosuccinate lyase
MGVNLKVAEERQFSLFSPTDYRYAFQELTPFLTEEAFIKYKIKVEQALIEILVKSKFCPSSAIKELKKISDTISFSELLAEEERTKHDLRALVNLIKKKVTPEVAPFVHFGATSYDIIDTANALRYREATEKVILPELIRLLETWLKLAENESETLQIGRTHGQHALPITFGFAIAQYVDRLGGRIQKLKEAVKNLRGKFSGAVGAYNALRIFFKAPERIEKEILSKLGLTPARVSTQIVPPEPMTDFAHIIISTFGILANFADDIRHLQRPEIGELSEEFTSHQVGSSTMPHKRNPISFENVKSMWKAFMPRMVTVYADQISEHQRDLTNSASQRYLPELLVVFTTAVRRIRRASERLMIDRERMRSNLKISEPLFIAEPLQLLLSFSGYPQAYEYVREKVNQALQEGKSLWEIVRQDKKVKRYLRRFLPHQNALLEKPTLYTGIASLKARKIVKYWKKELIKFK